MQGQRFGNLKLTLCAGLLLVAGAGCGGSESYDLAVVRGQVTCEGKPVPGGVVYFAPVAEAGTRPGPTAMGAIDENGNYALNTGQGTGAVVGRNRIRFEYSSDIAGLEEEVAALEADDDPEDLAEAKARLDAAKKLAANPINCRDPRETEVTVAPGENDIDIELTVRAQQKGRRGRPMDEDD